MSKSIYLTLVESDEEYILVFSRDKSDWIARFDKSWSEAYKWAKNMQNLYNQSMDHEIKYI
ncbi:hypothetical protein [Priestia megaterium]|uniref:hypothetical protein n=1 Tax=Priestia megaterium TaxID=1404 RepID=UPI002E226910|nr:hypothetical protein [Priestia megaterium]